MNTNAAGSRSSWAVESGLSLCHDVGPVLPRRVASFSRDGLALKEALQGVEAEDEPLIAESCRTFSIIRSAWDPKGLTIACLCASIRPDQGSLPKTFGLASPHARSSVCQQPTLAAPTAKRSAASRWVTPAPTVWGTRSRRSTDKDFDISIGFHLTDSLKHSIAD